MRQVTSSERQTSENFSPREVKGIKDDSMARQPKGEKIRTIHQGVSIGKLKEGIRDFFGFADHRNEDVDVPLLAHHHEGQKAQRPDVESDVKERAALALYP